MRGLPLWVRLIPTALVLSFFVLPAIWEDYKEHLDEEKDWAEYREYRAVFDERCKNAGETIYQTVQDVEGITLLKVWGDSPNNDMYNRTTKVWEFTGLPHEDEEEYYIRSYLYWWYAILNNQNGLIFIYDYNPISDKKIIHDMQNKYTTNRGYMFIDAIQNNSKYSRYELANDDGKMSKTIINKPARYAVTFDNPIISDERARWIATTIVTIIDTETNTILARKQWYSFEESRGKYHMHWSAAITCPYSGQRSLIRQFVQRVLIPKAGEIK